MNRFLTFLVLLCGCPTPDVVAQQPSSKSASQEQTLKEEALKRKAERLDQREIRKVAKDAFDLLGSQNVDPKTLTTSRTKLAELQELLPYLSNVAPHQKNILNSLTKAIKAVEGSAKLSKHPKIPSNKTLRGRIGEVRDNATTIAIEYAAVANLSRKLRATTVEFNSIMAERRALSDDINTLGKNTQLELNDSEKVLLKLLAIIWLQNSNPHSNFRLPGDLNLSLLGLMKEEGTSESIVPITSADDDANRGREPNAALHLRFGTDQEIAHARFLQVIKEGKPMKGSGYSQEDYLLYARQTLSDEGNSMVSDITPADNHDSHLLMLIDYAAIAFADEKPLNAQKEHKGNDVKPKEDTQKKKNGAPYSAESRRIRTIACRIEFWQQVQAQLYDHLKAQGTEIENLTLPKWEDKWGDEKKKKVISEDLFNATKATIQRAATIEAAKKEAEGDTK